GDAAAVDHRRARGGRGGRGHDRRTDALDQGVLRLEDAVAVVRDLALGAELDAVPVARRPVDAELERHAGVGPRVRWHDRERAVLPGSSDLHHERAARGAPDARTLDGALLAVRIAVREAPHGI